MSSVNLSNSIMKKDNRVNFPFVEEFFDDLYLKDDELREREDLSVYINEGDI